MRCVITAGPTFEPLDDVRRLTNFSTGRLGSELAGYLVDHGHEAVLLLGQLATCRRECHASRIETFTTTASLGDRLHALSGEKVDAIFHAAAVSDFAFGKLWFRDDSGGLKEVKAGKVSTRDGHLMAELVPTPKIISQLRAWFPNAILVGWKYEVDGDRASVLKAAEKQLAECRTTACVANGPAYGSGFGLVAGPGRHEPLQDSRALFEALEAMLR
jgi:phosphopantothenoylcysteine synthetase/decarboxylase